MSTKAQTSKGNHKKRARGLRHPKGIIRNEHVGKDIQRKSQEMNTWAQTSKGNHKKWARDHRHPKEIIGTQTRSKTSKGNLKKWAREPRHPKGYKKLAHNKWARELRHPKQCIRNEHASTKHPKEITRNEHVSSDIQSKEQEMSTCAKTSKENHKKWARELRRQRKAW